MSRSTIDMSSKRPKKQLTPEEKYIVRAKARRQFKAGFHRTVAHLRWLIPEKKPIVSSHDLNLFSFDDKCLLMKPIDDRTQEDNDQLIKLICNTKMLKHYPMSVRNGLACVTYLCCFGPERIISKQNRPATVYYFLLDGKIRETYETMDPLLNELVIEEKGIFGPGYGYGDISILNKTPRISTKTTLTDVMLLCVNKNDFENVLKQTVQEMWDEIREQFEIIPYFQQYNQKEIGELLIISRILYFEPDEILLGDQKGFKNFTYIILDGTCRMIENLEVIPCRTILSTTYTLHKPTDSTSVIAGNIVSTGTLNPSYPSGSAIPLKKNDKRTVSKEKKHQSFNDTPDVSKDTIIETTVNSSKTTSLYQSKGSFHRGSSYFPAVAPPNVETHYMQLCTMKYGSTFNVGENLKNRRIVAITAVKCLIVPKYWILTHDKDKTWISLCQLLDRHIPSTKQIFKEFKNQHKWLEYRKTLQDDVLSAHYYPSYNTVHNIPPYYRVEYQVPKD
ncbi:uncharacterized protein LOC123300315 [Chrysoperla carnea]|uniref:uncharacterized protein LOC123300315 n=1 Tax=Chrysoperla carnea TaxID=189513 RepID=UPI001D093810|nr:uncharacterized protein LOC123300315 [Chrysoperla carnea]